MSRPEARPENQMIQHTPADQIRLKSRIEGPVSGLDLLQRGLLMAETCLLGYLVFDERQKAAEQIGLRCGERVHADDIRAFLFHAHDDLIVMVRGPEPVDFERVRERVAATSELSDTVGQVQSGFWNSNAELWPQLEEILGGCESEKIWFTGHSLGAAVATLACQQFTLSPLRTEADELHTFGSPRVGSRKWAATLKTPHHRWVNHHDPICQLPSTLSGFVQTGDEQYLTEHGQLRSLSGWQKASESLKVWAESLRGQGPGQFAEHSILSYIDRLYNALRVRDLWPAGHRPPSLAERSK